MIYLVEDNQDILDLLCMLLMAKGFSVEGFTTATAFAERTSVCRPDLFILDINLPDGNGLDICAGLTTATLTMGIPVLLMSANAFYKDQYLQAAARDFISKPFQLTDFIQAINGLIGNDVNV